MTRRKGEIPRNLQRTPIGVRPVIGGDVKNRFSQPPLKKFLIPSLTKEKYFLFGRNIFFRSLPRDLCFFSLFSIKLLRAWHFDHISCSNWARTINRYSNDSFRSPEQVKSIIKAVRWRKNYFFCQKQKFSWIFLKKLKTSI